MRTLCATLSFAALLMLSGCADGLNIGSIELPKLGGHESQVSSDVDAGAQDALYLGVVDGLIKQGRYGAALAFLDSYQHSGDALTPRYWLLRGDALRGLHRDTEAKAAFAELHGTKFEPKGWNGQGQMAAENGDWPSADEYFRKAVTGDPANADFLNNLGYAQLHVGEANEATASLQQAHELEPGSKLILTNLAVALTMKGDTARANTVIGGVKDNQRQESMRTAVKNAVAELDTKRKS